MIKQAILGGSLIALTMAIAPVPDASANWGTYQYDALHTGKAPVKGPSIPNIKWQYQAPQQTFTDPNDPNNIWTADFSFTAGLAEGPDGTIYAAGDDGRAYAFDPRNGSVKFIFDGVGVCCAPPVVGKDGTIYFSGNGLWALNPDFTVRFYFPDGGNCCGAITVAADGTVIVGNGNLYAFDPNNLVFNDTSNTDPIMAKVVAPKWVYNALQADWAAAVSPDGLTIYATNYTQLIAINPASLTPNLIDTTDTRLYAATKWTVNIKNDTETIPVVAANGTIYIADDQSIVAVNPVTGVKSTVYSIPGKQVLKIAYNGSTLLATVAPLIVDALGARSIDENGDSEIHEINPVSHAKVWSTPLAGSGEYANPIIDSTGAVYTGTVQKIDGVDYMINVYMFDNSTPRKAIFTYTVGTIYGNDLRCPIIGTDGTLYAIINGALVAFGGTADLSPAIVATPNPVYTNGALSLTTTVSNAGPDKAVGATVKIVLPAGFTSFSSFILPSNCAYNPNSTRILNCALGDIAAGSSAPVTLSSTAQSTTGTESITATTSSNVPDSIATNNSKTLTVPVVAPITCDLTITAVGGPTAITRGTTKYSFTATVKNAGTGACAASTTGFYLSPATTAAGTQVGTVATNALAAGATQSLTLSTAIATTKLAAGTFYVGAVADSAAVVAETIETNNFKSATAKTTVK